MTKTRFIACFVLTLALGACATGGEHSLLSSIIGDEQDAPQRPELPSTPDEELKSKVKWDGYPDSTYVPNPERVPELSAEEEAAAKEELSTLSEKRLENRIMDCGAEDPADCVQ